MGFALEGFNMVVNNSVYCGSPGDKREDLGDEIEEIKDGFCENGRPIVSFRDLMNEECRESSSSFEFPASEVTVNEELSSSGDSSSPSSMASHVSDDKERTHLEKQQNSEIEIMKEKFSKLLLGEDMSGSGNGVSTALAISNAITNLCGTLFGQIWKLEPLPLEKKRIWRREMELLLSVSDHIVQLTPSWQIFPDGTKLEVMTCRPRSDLYVNLPALRKLDNMLLEILDDFEKETEFWYIDKGIEPRQADGSSSLKQTLPRQEEKWWLPVPQLPSAGLTENAKKQLQQKRDSTNQILKAAMAINNITLAEMDVPDSYLEALPKNGRASLGDLIYRSITSDEFSPESLVSCLNLSSEHQALEIANRIEASIYVWRQKTNLKSSWEMVKELVIDAEKRKLLSDRAENLLLCLKQKIPGLPQTTLDTSKIQFNKDVGKAILESYSRVLESLASNIVARIDDLFYIDDLAKHSCRLPISGNLYRSSFSLSRTERIIPTKGEKLHHLKKVLTDYLSIDARGKENMRKIGRSFSFSNTSRQQALQPS